MKIKEVNALSGKVTKRQMNVEELAQWQEDQEKLKSNAAAKESKAAAKRSGVEKLVALGLSPEEISAITG